MSGESESTTSQEGPGAAASEGTELPQALAVVADGSTTTIPIEDSEIKKAHDFAQRLPKQRQGIYMGLAWADCIVGWIELAFLVLALILLTLSALIQGISSLSGDPAHIYAELIRASVLQLAAMGGAYAAHKKRMIAMDLVSNAVKGPAGAWLAQIIRVATLAICLVTGYYAWKMAGTFETPAQATIPVDETVRMFAVGFYLIAFHQAMHIAMDVLAITAGVLPNSKTEQKVH